VRLAIQSQRRKSVTGNEGMIGETGKALTAIGPSEEGQVQTHGEIWQATAAEPIAPGARIRVTRVDGLRLTVQKE
jgi:membrane-bound serine protease (ClpP class)